MIREHILYEDNHLIVLNKPSGEIVQGDKTGDMPFSDKVKAYIKDEYNKPGNVYLGVPHRLDRPTSGIVVFTKTSKALTRVNAIFKERKVKKVYWALVEKKPIPSLGKLENYLWKNEKRNKSFVVEPGKKGAVQAILSYQLMYSTKSYFLVEVQLHTGRHHQIRVQLSNRGWSIKGDVKYGAKRTNPDASISLHARYLELPHPTTGELLKITAPVPADVVWKEADKGVAKKKPRE